MSAVPTIRPYATRDEWRRDFYVDTATHRASSQAGLATFVPADVVSDAPTVDYWECFQRETGERLALGDWEGVAGEIPRCFPGEVFYNRRTGEVVYAGGVQS